MDFFETVTKRRSACKFSRRPVARKDIVAMLEAAVLAPSATNEQLWFLVAGIISLRVASKQTERGPTQVSRRGLHLYLIQF